MHQQTARTWRRSSAPTSRGYRSVRPISDEALTLLPMFRLVRGLAQIGWYHQRPELDRAAKFDETKAVVLEQCLTIGREI